MKTCGVLKLVYFCSSFSLSVCAIVSTVSKDYLKKRTMQRTSSHSLKGTNKNWGKKDYIMIIIATSMMQFMGTLVNSGLINKNAIHNFFYLLYMLVFKIRQHILHTI